MRSSGLSAGLQSQNHQSGFAVPNGNAAVAVQGKTGSLLHGDDERGRAGYTGIVDTGPIVDAVLQMTASSVARCDLKISGGQKVGGKVVGDEIYSRLQEDLSVDSCTMWPVASVAAALKEIELPLKNSCW